MKAAICDDDFSFLEQLEEYVKKYEQKSEEPFWVYKFTSGRELLTFMEETADIDILFLDILFQNENGIEVAKEIRKINSKIEIIFVSSHDKFAVQGYEVNARGYLIKPLCYSTFEDKMNKVMDCVKESDNKFFCDATDKGKVLIEYSDLKYIETFERNTRLCTLDGTYISYKKMREHEQCLPESCFFRCHAAYIVNFRYVRRIEGMTLYLKDNTDIPISRAKRREFLTRFNEYVNLCIAEGEII